MKASWAARKAKHAPVLSETYMESEDAPAPPHAPPPPLRGQLLDRAKALTLGDRNKSYGDPSENFKAVCAIQNAFWLRAERNISEHSPIGHALNMVFTKLGRIASAPTREAALADDNFIDAIAYLAIAKEVAERS